MNKSIDEEDKLDGNARGMHGRMDMVVRSKVLTNYDGMILIK
ncbi:MAG: hypothetical protein ACKO1F_02900 [Flammeovirgaceae bacterium]